MKLKRFIAAALSGMIILAAFSGCTEEKESFDVKKAELSEEQKGSVERDINSKLNLMDYSGSAMVTLNKNTVYENYFGYADPNDNKVDKNTAYQLSSLTKAITAAAVVQLSDSGKLDLDDKLSKYFKGYDKVAKVTVKELLNNTKCLGYYNAEQSSDSALAAAMAKYQKTDDPALKEAVLKHILNNGVVQAQQGKVPNSNYYLLGELIERVSGQSYHEYVKENIYKKLGMKNSGFVTTKKKFKGIDLDNSKWKTQSDNIAASNYYLMYSSFGAVSTAQDMAKFYTALLYGKITKTNIMKLIKASSSGYSCGFKKDGRAIYAQGGTNLHSVYTHINTETLETVVLLSNQTGKNDISTAGKEIYMIVNAKINRIILEQEATEGLL